MDGWIVLFSVSGSHLDDGSSPSVGYEPYSELPPGSAEFHWTKVWGGQSSLTCALSASIKLKTTNTDRNHFLIANCSNIRSTFVCVSFYAMTDDAQLHLQRTGAPARCFLLCAGVEGSRAALTRDGGGKSSEEIKYKKKDSLTARIFWSESGNQSRATSGNLTIAAAGTVKGPGCKNSGATTITRGQVNAEFAWTRVFLSVSAGLWWRCGEEMMGIILPHTCSQITHTHKIYHIIT